MEALTLPIRPHCIKIRFMKRKTASWSNFHEAVSFPTFLIRPLA